jgi:RIO-like serine/threonine protein kinase
MHNKIQPAENIERYVVALNKVTSNLTREERKIMNNFNPYVQVPFVGATKMHAVVNGKADFNLPIYINKKESNQPFVAALAELVNTFIGQR